MKEYIRQKTFRYGTKVDILRLEVTSERVAFPVVVRLGEIPNEPGEFYTNLELTLAEARWLYSKLGEQVEVRI